MRQLNLFSFLLELYGLINEHLAFLFKSNFFNGYFQSKTFSSYTRGSCGVCRDFSSELADISVGWLGLEDWTFVIIRTYTYRQRRILSSSAERAGAIKTMDVRVEANALHLLSKLSRKKRQVASKEQFK